MSDKNSITTELVDTVKDYYDRKDEIREQPTFGPKAAIVVFVILTIVEFLLPIQGSRVIWYSNIFVLTCIYVIMAIGLNVHTGMTGMVNFGVIFFVGIGAITTGLLSVKFGINPFISMIIGMIISASFGYLMIYPTVRLRTDYFAIVTIALGEILRLALTVEPGLRASNTDSELTNLGISDIVKPFEGWWVDSFGNNSDFGITYFFLLGILALIMVIVTFIFAEITLNSPFGRILKGIREDDEVVESYGYDILHYKGIALAIGAAIMAFGGSLWAWYQGSIFPDFMDPVRSTFLVWAVFIVGGKANNYGMIAGSYIIVLMDFRLRTVEDIAGLNFNFMRFVIIGIIIILSMRFAKTGLIPEVPYRPEVEGYDTKSRVFDVIKCANCHALNRSDTTFCDSCGKSLTKEEVAK